MAKRVPSKDPDDVLDYWVDYVSDSGDTIASAAWEIPAGLTQVGSVTTTANRSTVFLSGGVSGTEYVFTCRVQTVAGRTLDQSFKLYVEEH